ncbi:MAG TPA: hypothetical protein VGZ00_04325 [Candidatus Baltobacteraceae bacterium]|jgi:hypothetical protein|nr:hypothetical protein [Candidatus Baltobacteraceae bacterium]
MSEQGSTIEALNFADATADGLGVYRARKRTISVRTLLLIFPLAALVAMSSIRLGLDLALGGGCGVVYMLTTMRAGERLLDGSGSVGAFRFGGMVRILVFAAIPVMASLHGPWWAMGAYFAGFFTPHILYALEVLRESHWGETCTSKSADT